MPALPFSTVDVFTQTRFGGNPLAVVTGADVLSDQTMQAVAAEFNLSETTFVLPPADPKHTARVRIFNRKVEMSFAGHPMVGTAFVLGAAQPDLSTATFEVPAGLVAVKILRDEAGAVTGAEVAAPQALSLGDIVDPAWIARVLKLEPSDIVLTTHAPVLASVGNPYVIAEVSADALTRCDPDLAAFREALAAHPSFGARFSVHVYCREGNTLRARMFAPLAGTWEDPATGSANAPLACLLLSLETDTPSATYQIHQGVEMGRPSLLHVTAHRASDGVRATLRGACVPVMTGLIDCG